MHLILLLIIFIQYNLDETTATSEIANLTWEQYDVSKDVRLSEKFRDEFYQLKTINNHRRSVATELARTALWQCLLSDPTITEVILTGDRQPDTAPFPILSEFGDHLCKNVTQTVKCYENYLESISAAYLKEKPLRNVNSKLVPLQRILSKVCDKSGKILNTQTQNILKCIDGNSELYHNCRDGNLGLAMHNVADILGVIPYFYEYSCRQLDVTEECVRKTVQNCNSVADAYFVGELINEIRSTPICEQAKAIPKQSYRERIYQLLDLFDCPFSKQTVRYDDGNITMCPNLPFGNIIKNITVNFKGENWPGIMQSVCPHLPDLVSCIDTMGTVVSDCILNDYKHFPQQGFKPMLRLLESVCSDLVPNISEFLLQTNLDCFVASDTSVCTEPFNIELKVKNTFFPAGLLYLDYEMFSDLQRFQQCLIKQLQACDGNFVNAVKGVLDVLINEISQNPLTYTGL